MCLLCRQWALWRADHSSRGILLCVYVSVYLTVCDLETSTLRRARGEWGCHDTEKETNAYFKPHGRPRSSTWFCSLSRWRYLSLLIKPECSFPCSQGQCASWIHFTPPQFIFWRSFFTLLCHISLSFLNGLKFCIQLSVRAIRLAHRIYFHFITFRVINGKIAKGKTVQISAVPSLCHVTRCMWLLQNQDRKYWKREGRNILKLIYRKSIPLMWTKSDFLKIECNAQDGWEWQSVTKKTFRLISRCNSASAHL